MSKVIFDNLMGGGLKSSNTYWLIFERKKGVKKNISLSFTPDFIKRERIFLVCEDFSLGMSVKNVHHII